MDIIITAGQFGLACFLGSVIAGTNSPAWVKWPTAFIAGLFAWVSGITVATMICMSTGAMLYVMLSGYIFTAPAALGSLFYVSRKRRRAAR